MVIRLICLELLVVGKFLLCSGCKCRIMYLMETGHVRIGSCVNVNIGYVRSVIFVQKLHKPSDN